MYFLFLFFYFLCTFEVYFVSWPGVFSGSLLLPCAWQRATEWAANTQTLRCPPLLYCCCSGLPVLCVAWRGVNDFTAVSRSRVMTAPPTSRRYHMVLSCNGNRPEKYRAVPYRASGNAPLLLSFCPVLYRYWSNSKYSFVFRPIQLVPACCVLPSLWVQMDPRDKWPAWMQILASNHQLPTPF